MSCKVQQSVCSCCVTYAKSRIDFNNFNTFNNVEQSNIQIVENSVCRYFNITANDLSSKKRNTDTTMARGFAIYILHTSFGYSASKLAAEYRRTPRAVFWHVDKISHLIKQRAYKEMYQTLISDLNH